MSADRPPDRLAHVCAGIDFEYKQALAWHLRRARAALCRIGGPAANTSALAAKAKVEIKLCLSACDRL